MYWWNLAKEISYYLHGFGSKVLKTKVLFPVLTLRIKFEGKEIIL